jgi:subtilisin family serine protease
MTSSIIIYRMSLLLFGSLFLLFILTACISGDDDSSSKSETATATNKDLTTYQWHLVNTGQKAFSSTAGTSGEDINQATTYNGGNKGDGVIVAVVDTGMELGHEDLSPNVISGGSWDYLYSDTNPTNNEDDDGDHGTSVAGLIAAADNSLGGRGVAAEAELKGFNFLQTQGTTNYINAIGGSISSPNSSDVDIFNLSFGYTNTDDFMVTSSVEAQYLDGVTNLRGGKGGIYVKSAGNGFKDITSSVDGECDSANAIGVSCQNSNMDPESALPYIIVVGATNAKGEKSSYSTAGSNLLISAPGGEYGYDANLGWSSSTTPTLDEPAMVTTDQSGCSKGYSNTSDSPENELEDNTNGLNPNCDYTATFNGTSSAAPVLSGAIALMLNANSNLTWRDVKHILITTAAKTPLTVNHGKVTVSLSGGQYTVEDTWVTNGAGHEFHNWYGFGQLDVDAAVAAASGYTLNSLGTFVETAWVADGGITDGTIDDNNISGANDTIVFGTTLTIETVQIKISVSHNYVGDLGIELTSPAGTKSILLNARNGFSSSDDLTNMVLTSNAFYGETSNGTWTIKVVDADAVTSGTFDSWSMKVNGH